MRLDNCGDSYGNCASRNVSDYHGVGADNREISNVYASQDLGPCADIYVCPKHRKPRPRAGSQCDLLE